MITNLEDIAKQLSLLSRLVELLINLEITTDDAASDYYMNEELKDELVKVAKELATGNWYVEHALSCICAKIFTTDDVRHFAHSAPDTLEAILSKYDRSLK